MSEDCNFKYLVSSKKDILWGITVDNVGSSDIPSGYDQYPPLVGHPEAYYFRPEEGRILDNYQFIYISQGKGKVYFSPDRSIEIDAGKMLVIPQYTWHSYHPDKKTGWKEHWIGIRGSMIDNWFENNFVDPEQRIFKVGFSEEIIKYFRRAQEIASEERPGYQQVLASIANMIFSLTLYNDVNKSFTDDRNIQMIEQARAIIRENYLTDITPQQVARRINMSYSWFRKMFKEYTSISPAQYIIELKLQAAKNLLMNSPLSIKEIAFNLNYIDALYFSTLFKKHVGYSPSVFREMYNNVENDPSRI